MKEYQVVVEQTRDEFTNKLTNLTKDGWQLVGSMGIITVPGTAIASYYILMERENENQETKEK